MTGFALGWGAHSPSPSQRGLGLPTSEDLASEAHPPKEARSPGGCRGPSRGLGPPPLVRPPAPQHPAAPDLRGLALKGPPASAQTLPWFRRDQQATVTQGSALSPCSRRQGSLGLRNKGAPPCPTYSPLTSQAGRRSRAGEAPARRAPAPSPQEQPGALAGTKLEFTGLTGADSGDSGRPLGPRGLPSQERSIGPQELPGGQPLLRLVRPLLSALLPTPAGTPCSLHSSLPREGGDPEKEPLGRILETGVCPNQAVPAPTTRGWQQPACAEDIRSCRQGLRLASETHSAEAHRPPQPRLTLRARPCSWGRPRPQGSHPRPQKPLGNLEMLLLPHSTANGL